MSGIFIRNPIIIVDNIPYLDDDVRNKTLSVYRTTFSLGQDSANNGFLKPLGLDTPGSGSGYEIIRNATIVSLSAHARGGNLTKSFDVVRNDVLGSPLFTFSFPGAASPNISFSDDIINVDIIAGDHLQVFASGTGTASLDVVVNIEIAWRI